MKILFKIILLFLFISCSDSLERMYQKEVGPINFNFRDQSFSGFAEAGRQRYKKRIDLQITPAWFSDHIDSFTFEIEGYTDSDNYRNVPDSVLIPHESVNMIFRSRPELKGSYKAIDSKILVISDDNKWIKGEFTAEMAQFDYDWNRINDSVFTLEGSFNVKFEDAYGYNKDF